MFAHQADFKSSGDGVAEKAGELTIGELARRTGRAASTIRYYESAGVLPEPERVGGRRGYPRDAVRRLGVIDTAQRAGLSLQEITELLGAWPGVRPRPSASVRSPSASCPSWRGSSSVPSS